MSDYYYSFKERGFFYQPDTESDNYPDDLISLTDEQYHELMQGQAEGKYIEHKKTARRWLITPTSRWKMPVNKNTLR